MKDLMKEVMIQRFNTAKDVNEDPEVRSKALKEGMELEKLILEEEKFESAKIENKKADKKRDVLKYIEIAIVPATLMVLDFAIKMKFAKTVIGWEEEGIRTSTPGKTFNQFFKWKN